MASIRIESKTLIDPRFKILGTLMGVSRFDARARMEELWSYCTEKQTYFLTPELINALTEFPDFHKLILSSEVGLAEETEKGIRIRGTKGRIEWYKRIKSGARRGGRARIEKAQRNQSGRFQPSTSPPRASTPARSSVLTLTLTPTNNTKYSRRIEYPTEFEQIYKIYPRREGKKAGFKIYLAQIKTEADRADLVFAIGRYKKIKAGKDPQFLLMFSSFMSQWTDWLEPDAGTIVTPSTINTTPLKLEELL